MLDSYKTVEFEDGVPVLEEFAYVNEVCDTSRSLRVHTRTREGD